MNKHIVFHSIAFSLIALTSSCKSSSGSSKAQSDASSSPSLDAGSRTLLDVNDVSILFPRPTNNAAAYIRLSDKSSEGPLLSEDLFQQTVALGHIVDNKYESWAVSGVRIDNCAKLLVQLPCEVQIRLVLQPLEGDSFGDEGIHLPFIVDHADEMQFYKDFIALKKSALPETTKGPLGVHPILAKEGMEGPFAKKLKELVLKYSRASKFERIAAMGTTVKSKRAEWFFAASLPMKGGSKIEATPIPCQNGEKSNVFESLTIDGIVATMPSTFSASVSPDVSNCGNLDVTKLILERRPRKVTFSEEEMAQITDSALAINDPSKVFFGSTTCVNCHLAGRRLGMAKGIEFLTADDGNPNRYKAPDDVTAVYNEESSGAGGNTWNIRAFGWNDTGDNPAISLYTFNDTMRVAHEINDLIRAGKLD